MRHKLFRRKAKGQSIPLIALMIVVIVAMVGLSVDVGGAYAEQRSAVRAANAAAIAGMRIVTRNGNDSNVATAILESLKTNGIYASNLDSAITADTRKVTAFYLDGDGNPMFGGCAIGTCGNTLQGVQYIEVRIEGYTETNFARVVGTKTLPINAQAFAAQCAPTTGVYPIGVNQDLLTFDEQSDREIFAQPTNPEEMKYYGIYRDGSVPEGAYQRRIYLKENLQGSGQFSWLRWRGGTNDGSATNTEAAFRGDGTLQDGYEEAAWPPVKGPSWDIPAPNGYPIKPGQISENDWIHANTGLSWGPASDALLQQKNNRTIMILPIIDPYAYQNGNNVQFQVKRLGNFLIREVGNEPSRGKFIDLVYLGPTTTEACNNTPPPPRNPQRNPDLVGNLAVLPEARDSASKRPVLYAVAFDVSGSMNWNFNGQAKINGQVRQCGAGADNSLNAKRAQDAAICNATSNKDQIWTPLEERRLYIAKQAMMQFIDMMDPNDRMQIIPFSGANPNIGGIGAIELGDAAGKTKLKQYVLDAGKSPAANNDPYIALGGTPSASALYKARQILGASTTPKKAPNGQDYKQVVMLITDGVANHYRDPAGQNGTYTSGGNVGWNNLAPDQELCRNSPNVGEDVRCHVGYADTSKGQLARPLTAMVNEGTELQKQAQVFVIALAGVDATGLPMVSSQDIYPWFAPANQPSSVTDVFRAINNQVENGDCEPAPYVGWTYEIDSSHTVSASEAVSLGGTADAVYGVVRLLDSNGQLVAEKPITQAVVGSSTRLTYRFDNVPPGNYAISAVIFYKGDDGIARKYPLIRNPDLTTSAQRVQVVQRGTSLNNTIAVDPLWMQLAEAVCPPA
ncbi:MAG TPA: vWA domain-containing protein [Roseiflexaceae bacterium]|nr:vWA domain-containing protein [Roseiflexaceae bacterium]